jgi:hypothetical protein
MKLIFRRSGRIPICIFLLTACSCLFAQHEKKLSFGEQEVFKVARTNTPMVIDGKLNEEAWQKTESRSLDYFYRVEKPTDQQNTVFRMLWDDENLYVFFACEDQYITARERNRDGRPYLDDCAEIFLIPVPDSLNVHYGFELNLYKASNDFIYLNNFYQGKNAAVRSYDPDFEVEVTVDGTVNDNSDLDKGWTMEMALPLTLFKGMDRFSPVKAGNQWGFLAIRQERNDAEGNRRITSTIFPIYDINKDVHQPNRFGLMEFVE